MFSSTFYRVYNPQFQILVCWSHYFCYFGVFLLLVSLMIVSHIFFLLGFVPDTARHVFCLVECWVLRC